MKTIAIVGLGTMGHGLAQVYAAAGFKVLATDAHAPTRDSAGDRLAAALGARVATGKLSPEARDATLANLTIVESIQAFAPASLVIEAIVEKLTAKQALVAELEQVVASTAIVATNTSSLSVNAIAARAKHPERILGLHFFNPAPVMKLVEVVPHAHTTAQALTEARQITEVAGKTVIQCSDRPGFIVNRCARPFYGEALAMLEEGRSASDIDAAMLTAGYRLGPFQLIDLIGADINLAATEGLFAAMGGNPRYYPFEPLRRQVALGRLGRKSGAGFLFPDDLGPPPTDASEIVLRIESTLVNEAAWLLSEGGISANDIDTAIKLGLNFPRGPFEILKAHGIDAIRAKLEKFEAKTPFNGRYILAQALRLE